MAAIRGAPSVLANSSRPCTDSDLPAHEIRMSRTRQDAPMSYFPYFMAFFFTGGT
jgi:hypothetical protein